MPLLHTDKDPVAIGVRLKQAREAAGLSQRELAKKGPYTAAYISRIEAGARVPTFDCLRVFAEGIGVTAEWLETGTVEPIDRAGQALRMAAIAKRSVELAIDALHEAHAELEKVLA